MNIAIAILLLVLEGADIVTTVLFLKRKTATEANPLLSRLMARFGLAGAFAIKLAPPAALAVVLLHYPPNPILLLCGILSCALLAWVVAGNASFLRRPS